MSKGSDKWMGYIVTALKGLLMVLVKACAFLLWILLNLIVHISKNLSDWIKKWLFPKEY